MREGQTDKQGQDTPLGIDTDGDKHPPTDFSVNSVNGIQHSEELPAEYRYRKDTPLSLIYDRVLLNAMPIIQNTLPVHTFRRHEAIYLSFRSPVLKEICTSLSFNSAPKP